MNSNLAQYFDDCAEQIKKCKDCLKKQMSNDDLSLCYGLFKQATVGDNNTERPGMFSFEGKAKWDAWTAHKGKSSEQAKAEYVTHVMTFLPDSISANYK
jgi:diazepam-binding inhibitor (GABA receptor modulating acyl-CoA-binding protein)